MAENNETQDLTLMNGIKCNYTSSCMQDKGLSLFNIQALSQKIDLSVTEKWFGKTCDWNILSDGNLNLDNVTWHQYLIKIKK